MAGALAIAITLALAGCGGATPSDETAAGGELLGWDQLAASSAEVRSYAFTLYVDSKRLSGLTDVRCGDEAGATGYACSAPVPTLPSGTHTLQLTATVNGVEGDRSAPLTVTIPPR